jgi:hypothetical protein
MHGADDADTALVHFTDLPLPEVASSAKLRYAGPPCGVGVAGCWAPGRGETPLVHLAWPERACG